MGCRPSAKRTVRAAGIALGVAAYVLFSRLLASRAGVFAPAERVGPLLRAAWITGVAVQALAASLFAPDRFGAVHDAGLSIVAAFPLLLVWPCTDPEAKPAAPIARSYPILIAGVIGFLAFALTMGRGIY